jgi:hypothetical protein
MRNLNQGQFRRDQRNATLGANQKQAASVPDPKFQEIRSRGDKGPGYQYEKPSKREMNKGIKRIDRIGEKLNMGNAAERNSVRRARNLENATQRMQRPTTQNPPKPPGA